MTINAVDRVLGEAIDALSHMDAARLEDLAASASALAAADAGVFPPSRRTANLQHTLAELLRNSKGNIRLLSELRLVRVAGSGEWSATAGEAAWVR